MPRHPTLGSVNSGAMMMHIGRLHAAGGAGARAFWAACAGILKSRANITGGPEDYWRLTAAFPLGDQDLLNALFAAPTRAEIETLLAERFTGTVMQRPPAFSAMKVGGRRAYALARKGETPELAPRPVTIHSITVTDYAWPLLSLDIHCGKGTYVRSIARELGQALGTGGHCTMIRRTAVGSFTIDRAVSMDALPEKITQEWLDAQGATITAPNSAGQ
jgi:hypothetical protein